MTQQLIELACVGIGSFMMGFVFGIKWMERRQARWLVEDAETYLGIDS